MAATAVAAVAAAASVAAGAATTHSAPRIVTVAALQFACVNDVDANLRRAEALVRDAARKGANIILLQELFATLYFPIDHIDCRRLAISPDDEKNYIVRFQSLARELNVVIPLSFYERANNVFFNSVVIIDADGSQVGVYRKAHIPDGPGYQEKLFFSPGDTGFRIFKTRYAAIGVAISWDQWFPEAGRVMALQGADLLLYPTAIGSEPQDPSLDTCAQWQRCMQGHAAANMVPVIAANRVGKEIAVAADVAVTFYGSSFMTDHTGAIVSDAGRHQETVLIHTYNLDEIRSTRHNSGIYRDRRPDLYAVLCSLDGILPTVLANEPRRPAPPSPQPPPPPPPPPPPQQAHQPPPPPPQALPSGFPGATRVSVAPPPTPPGTAAAAPPPPLPTLVQAGKKVDTDPLVNPHAMVPVVEDPQRRVMSNTFDLHEASFIGEVRASAQRRPRGRCWVCRAKTTYECKLCSPGPVPLCNRTARECWWKYHAGEITQYVPNKRGRKRRKPNDADVVPDAENHHGNEESEDVEDKGQGQDTDPVAVGALLD